jgi:ribosomal protein S14
MKYLNYLSRKDLKRRDNFFTTEMEYLRVLALSRNFKLIKCVRFFYSLRLNCVFKNFTKVRIKNRCVLTSKSQSVYRLFHLNRSSLKNAFSMNKLFAIRKSSW